MAVRKKAPDIHATDCIKTLEFDKNEVLVFQLPIPTKEITQNYTTSARNAIAQAMPPGTIALIMGNDIDIFSISKDEATALKLKGLIF